MIGNLSKVALLSSVAMMTSAAMAMDAQKLALMGWGSAATTMVSLNVGAKSLSQRALAGTTVKVVAGTSCSATSNQATYVPGTAGQEVVASLCVTLDSAEPRGLCGTTLGWLAADTASVNQVKIQAARSLYSGMAVASSAAPSLISSTTNANVNFSAIGFPTASPEIGVGIGKTIKVAEYVFVPETSATGVINLTTNAIVGWSRLGASATTCGEDIFEEQSFSNAIPTLILSPAVTPALTLACTPTTLTDSAGQVATCSVTASAAPTSAITVNVTPPAANGRYTATSCANTVSLAAGATTATACTITATSNTTLGDGSATATVALAAGTGYTLGTPSSATVTVNDDEVFMPQLSLASTSTTLNVGTGASATITATLDTAVPAGSTFTVPLNVNGLNINSSDSTCASPGIVIPAGSKTGTCTVRALSTGTAASTVTVGAACTTTCTNAGTSSVSVEVKFLVPAVSVTCDKPAIVGDVAANATSTCTIATTARKSMSGKNFAQDLPVTVAFTAPTDAGLFDAATSTCDVTSVTIPANATSTTCTIVTPVNTLTSSGSATLTVVAGTGYTVGTAATTVLVNGGRATPVNPGLNGAGANAIPTLSEMGMALLAMLMGGAAFIMRRRQQG